MLSKIQDEKSAQCCKAERSLLFHIEGGCQIAMGVNTALDGDQLTMTATVLSRDGASTVRSKLLLDFLRFRCLIIRNSCSLEF
jgi:porphobilinogen deaminase